MQTNTLERLSVRTPMQWTSEKNAGFTTADTAFRPVIDKGEYGFEKLNVAAQTRDNSSLLNWNKRMIQLRKSCPEIGLGEYKLIDAGSPAVLAIKHEYNGQSLIIVHNFSDKAVKASLDSGKSKVLYDLMIASEDKTPKAGKFVVSLEGFGYKWYRVDHIIP